MRILIKGGVWKNTEDEILKAAVMKYGLNQWARISSLLVRKSAKQCKARWYEWLDPAIKKTEWTREEDEKLLHLAKLMPTQWRTIAPIVGRTAAQCLDRYEKLLDMAAGKEKYEGMDDPRRLRPGEIDPNPEAKPARPDPVDMDEDEKEMLSEARARMANTRGKKAKRKAREKQLEEARRLASMQKKRELKAAGIEMRARQRRGRGIDYGKEVPFEAKPAAGFYDISEEAQATKEMREEFRPITIDELEGKKRRDIEAALVKQDQAKKQIAERQNAPSAVKAMLEANEAAQQRRRGKMMLPAPQISDAELEQLARAGEQAGAMDVDLTEGGSSATRQLLGDYATPAHLATPMRTPARTPAAAGGNRIHNEALNLRMLQSGQTPLLGGDNPELHPSDFAGVTPRTAPTATPNPLAAAAAAAAGGATPSVGATPSLLGGTPGHGGTPGRGGGGGALPATGGRTVAGISATPLLPSSTPGRGGSVGPSATPTPMRDALGLNDPDAFTVAASKREEAARLALLRTDLRAGLGQLPAPRNEYQIVVPEMPEDEAAEEGFEEDAAEREARKKAAAEAARLAELRKRSAVMQRSLPRPASLELLPEPRPDSQLDKLSARELAEELLQREYASLITFEHTRFPLKEKKGKGAAAAADAGPAIDQFEEEELAAASQLLRSEVDFVRQAMNHSELETSDYAAAWEAVAKDIIYVPSQQRYTRAASATNSDRIASLQAEFDAVRKEMEKEAKRAAKLEQKAGLVTGGLTKRQQKLLGETDEAWAALQSAATELECFRLLHEAEQRSAPDRIEALQALVAVQSMREGDLQGRYRRLCEERDDLRNVMRVAAEVPATAQ
ncbi:hypothetical protein D9Q98_005547 [Chlorella vulgaris]|uniref:Uncharacterized protein n=1 Tax=Chlorella vulgaris TaxID=3077 RepID=A0A9D4TM15_CHLVU|nr:hypothetical protein D9Q98_005547 [Chlorella vulgaris]